jgi:hypothetical protein
MNTAHILKKETITSDSKWRSKETVRATHSARVAASNVAADRTPMPMTMKLSAKGVQLTQSCTVRVTCRLSTKETATSVP